jgi:hypothetical protein
MKKTAYPVPIFQGGFPMKRMILKLTACLLLLAMTACALTVLPLSVGAEAPEIEGDASRLTVSKANYAEGEAIMVSAIGSGTDWIGIYRVGAPHSIRWTYVDAAKGGPGSGNEVNLRTVPDVNAGEPTDLPAGTYIIRLMANDSSDFANCIAMTTITIGSGAADTTVSAPLSATYEQENDTDGFAAGTVTVKMPAGCFVLYPERRIKSLRVFVLLRSMVKSHSLR